MSRPDERPLRRLPQLAARKATFERCVFCPKLCRSACPVSNVEQRETLTPWGKMSMAYFVANESVELAPSFTNPAWACTGCFGCREHCDHKNDVTGALFDSRSAFVEAGSAPEPATRVLDRFSTASDVLRNNARELSVLPEVKAEARTAVLVGCAYARRPELARAAVRSVARLTGGPVSLVDVCCGAPLAYAGAKKRFVQQGEQLAQAAKHVERLVVVDAGCAATIRVHHANNGQTLGPPVQHFTEVAAKELAMLTRAEAGTYGNGDVRWHDPCQLGRGLGVYDAPRAILGRVLGRSPDEFERKRQDARCSGAGGLVPVTMPEVSRAMARDRLADHERSGGGTVVTGCASSLRSFERQGARVVDLVTVVARALGVGDGNSG
jgi:dimethylglycine catabolism B